MFKKAEMVILPDGNIKFVNIELDESVIKDILTKCENNGFKIRGMKEAYNDTFNELGNLVNLYDDPGEIIRELENKINTQFNKNLEENKMEVKRRETKRGIIDSINDQIEDAIDKALELGDEGETNVVLEIPQPESKEVKEPEILQDKTVIQEPIEFVDEPTDFVEDEPVFVLDVDVDEETLYPDHKKVVVK